VFAPKSLNYYLHMRTEILYIVCVFKTTTLFFGSWGEGLEPSEARAKGPELATPNFKPIQEVIRIVHHCIDTIITTKCFPPNYSSGQSKPTKWTVAQMLFLSLAEFRFRFSTPKYA
jgi:hypothetical protein